MAAKLERLLDQNPTSLADSLALFPGIESQFEVHRGKVRDNYYLPGDQILMVATDRISTYDVVHPTIIPGKGIILTQMTLGFLNGPIKDVVPNHLLSADPQDFPEPFRSAPQLLGRTMLVERLDMVPMECVVRGYITGSAWSEYRKTGQVCGIDLPGGMMESQKFSKPVFTPATKAVSGHDENITFDEMAKQVGDDLASHLRIISMAVYHQAADYALSRGIIIADTKFELGRKRDGSIVLADEVLTPDSSRYWSVDSYQIGRPQDSLDKQYVRDYAAFLGWNKQSPGPNLSDKVVLETRRRYLQAYQMLFD